jgi:DNA (cytosine-5)-methyltransferase 1
MPLTSTPTQLHSRNTNGVDRKLRVVSLFSGGGGLDLGLEAAGFHTSVATDIDAHSCITLRQLSSHLRPGGDRSGSIVVEADIKNLDPKKLLLDASLRSGEVELLAGGPPCQAFSVFGKRRGIEDPRGTLAFEYLRVLAAVEPEAFVFENVYGLMTIDGGRVLDVMIEKLSRPKRGLRYEISMHRLNAVDYGVPQFRDRVFLIGSRSGARVRAVPTWVRDVDDLFTSELPPRRTVADALRDLPAIGSAQIGNHLGRDHSARIIARYAGLQPGERDPKTRINRLDLARPSFTIIVGSDKGGGKGHVHPTEPREVTPRESARIQTFPDWWRFSGTSRHPIRQVGNAVPPLLGAAVGSAIKSQLFGLAEVSLETAIDVLGQKHLFAAKDGVRLRRRGAV